MLVVGEGGQVVFLLGGEVDLGDVLVFNRSHHLLGLYVKGINKKEEFSLVLLAA